MNNRVFGQLYADLYDILYKDKDYKTECDLLEKIFYLYSSNSVNTILDLGCGTGKHAMIFAQRGYKVTGVDCSEDMLTKARQEVQALDNISYTIPVFYKGDLQTIDLCKQFDSVLMMFAVLGYQLTNEGIEAALRTVQRHLKPEGLFICDVWYGPAVLSIRPTDRIKIIPTERGKIIRTASGSLDTFWHLSTVHYHLWQLEDQRVISESEEIHRMRYFFPQELALFMSNVGLTLLHVCTFGNLDEAPSEHTWNILAIGKLI